jgi:hypothetical protein
VYAYWIMHYIISPCSQYFHLLLPSINILYHMLRISVKTQRNYLRYLYLKTLNYCHKRKQWGAKDKISFDIVNMNVSKIITIKGTIRKMLNTLAAHIWGLRYPPICLFDTLFSWQCPFNTRFLRYTTWNRNLVSSQGSTDQLICGLPHVKKNNLRSAPYPTIKSTSYSIYICVDVVFTL